MGKKTKTTISLLVFLLIAFGSCTSPFKKQSYRIAIDSDFSSLELDGMETNVYGFCNELFQEIAQIAKIDFVFVKTSWDIIESGLKSNSYQAMISGLPTYVRHKESFDFSHLFLPTGPILVLSNDLNATTLSELKDKVIGVVSGAKTSVLLDYHPQINMRPYPSIPRALNAIDSGAADGALIPNLFAQNYVHNLYSHSLKIVGEPLTDAGLRLITLHDKNPKLLSAFNAALATLKENGQLDAIMKKWELLY